MEEDCEWPISVNIRLYKNLDDMECISVEAMCLSCVCVVADRLPGENSAHSELYGSIQFFNDISENL